MLMNLFRRSLTMLGIGALAACATVVEPANARSRPASASSSTSATDRFAHSGLTP